jgi:hypothetical protein
MHRRLAAAAVPAPALAIAACGGGSGPGSSSEGAERPAGIDPSSFVRRVDNPYYPLRPGSTYRYRGVKDGEPSVDVVAVTARPKTILGVATTVVRDRLYVRGKLAEATLDWFAQDRKGNVWYFGEDTKELDRRGRVVSTEGSWQAGVDGAQPGIVMPAEPRVGRAFRQEHYAGHAEDHFQIVRLDARVAVPYLSTRHALETREWTPLEPGVIDSKYYVRGTGMVLERTVKGGDERSALVSVTRARRR